MDLLTYRSPIRAHGDKFGALAIFNFTLADGSLYEAWVTANELFDDRGRTAVTKAATMFTDFVGVHGLAAFVGHNDALSMQRTYQDCMITILRVNEVRCDV